MAKILADENIPKSVVGWLRSVGHDVVRTSEVGLRGASDGNVIGWAEVEGRIILTLDLYFASLYHRMEGLFGVVIVRIYPATRADKDTEEITAVEIIDLDKLIALRDELSHSGLSPL